MRRLAVLLALLSVARGSGDESSEHRRADLILFPEFVSKMNAFSLNHALDEPNHFEKVNVKDRQRLEEARKAWREYDTAMRHAGY